MEEPDTSPDSVGGPMLTNQKKDKICLVCGDRALGYNFNAVSCESCKAFFRRNAHKTIRGRCEGKCDVNIESRSFCKRCRLAKCFTVGMRKDMILDDDQKKLRKQKILINKLRRHGTFPPEDTYAVSEEDLRHSYNQKIVKHSIASLKKQYPSLSAEELACLQNMKTDESGLGDIKSDPLNSSAEFEPWQDVKDNLSEVLSEMDESDRQILLEMNLAHENSTFLSNTQTKLKSLPTTPTEMFNIADGFVRRIIKVVKQLKMFRNICKDDQIAMLKGSVVEIMVLRSAVNFDVKTETWTLNTKQVIGPSPSGTKPSCTVTSAEAGVNDNDDEKPVKPAGLNIEELRRAARSGADINTLRNLARQGSNENTQNFESKVNPLCSFASETRLKNIADHNPSFSKPSGLSVEDLSKAARMGADINTLRNLAQQSNIDFKFVQASNASPDHCQALNMSKRSSSSDYEQALNMSKRAHFTSASGENIDLNELQKGHSKRFNQNTNSQELGASMSAQGRNLTPDVLSGFRSQTLSFSSSPSGGDMSLDDLRRAANRVSDLNNRSESTNLNEIRSAANRAADLASRSENVNLDTSSRAADMTTFGEKINIDELRNAAMRGADLNTLRDMAKGRTSLSEQNTMNLQNRRTSSESAPTTQTVPEGTEGSENVERLRNAAKSAGLDIDALRNAAMNGASFEDLSRMARGEHVEIGKQSDGSSSNLSAEILKMGNSETRTMFLTYSKFIRSLMKTIHGDLILLKFMIMLSLFSADRPGITNQEMVEKYQEAYANSFQSYIQRRFPNSKNMFAQCIMKLTDLRNVNEIHTKMLLKMQVQDIEPLLVEIFDLPQ